MSRIIKCELSDVQGRLTNVALLDVSRLAATSQDELFLCALGFEPRCLSLPCSLKEAGYKARRAVYFKYGTNVDDNNVNLPELEAHLRGVADTVEPLEADADDFPTRLRALITLAISESSTPLPYMTFDISVAANRLLLRCVKVLLECDIGLRIVYSEAATYHPTKAEYEQEPDKWQRDEALGLERGVSHVMPSVDHPGHALDPLPDFLILFPSFKPERSQAVISFVDPSLLTSPRDEVVWLLGLPHLPADRWRLDAMKAINRIGTTTPQYEVSTFDYKETVRVLERLHLEKSESHTITVSPLGSKMQALGTALFCYMHPDVRVVFATPREYNAAQYSDGCKDVWEIDFGTLGDLRRTLDEVGTLRIPD